VLRDTYYPSFLVLFGVTTTLVYAESVMTYVATCYYYMPRIVITIIHMSFRSNMSIIHSVVRIMFILIPWSNATLN
jgi:hypothetical protein